MLDILKFGMSLEIFKILCVADAYLNILPVLVNDKKMSEYFHVDWRLDIFRFWLQLAGGLISLTVRTAEEQPQQQPVCQW